MTGCGRPAILCRRELPLPGRLDVPRSGLTGLGKYSMDARWPDIPYAEWCRTSEALHRWLQIAGKYRLARSPWLNHSWHATFQVEPRGLSTGPFHDGDTSLALSFDLIDHRFIVETSRGASTGFPLAAMSVAAFHDRVREAVAKVGGSFAIDGAPNETPAPIPFERNFAVRPYDADAVGRFHLALLCVHRVFSQFRTSFVGKVSPVHLFWGSFDLAVTRFFGTTRADASGRCRRATRCRHARSL